MNKFLTTKSAAEYLNVSRATIYRWISERKIPFYKPNNGRVYFKIEDLDDLIESSLVSSL